MIGDPTSRPTEARAVPGMTRGVARFTSTRGKRVGKILRSLRRSSRTVELARSSRGRGMRGSNSLACALLRMRGRTMLARPLFIEFARCRSARTKDAARVLVADDSFEMAQSVADGLCERGYDAIAGRVRSTKRWTCLARELVRRAHHGSAHAGDRWVGTAWRDLGRLDPNRPVIAMTALQLARPGAGIAAPRRVLLRHEAVQAGGARDLSRARARASADESESCGSHRTQATRPIGSCRGILPSPDGHSSRSAKDEIARDLIFQLVARPMPLETVMPQPRSSPS